MLLSLFSSDAESWPKLSLESLVSLASEVAVGFGRIDLNPGILVSGGKLGGMLEVLLELELELEVEVLVLGLLMVEELTPPLLLLGPRTILKELSRFSVGMVTMGVELS